MYKKIILLVLLTGTFNVLCNAQNSATNSTATVYLIRSTGMPGNFSAFNAFVDDSLICRLNNNRYSIHILDSGLHKFQVRFDGNKTRKKIQTLNIPMEAGQTYYITMEITGHTFTESLFLTEVTVNTARKLLPSLKEDTNCK